MSSQFDGLLLLSLLGILCGLLAGGAVIAFRLLVEHGSEFILSWQTGASTAAIHAESFESLSAWQRLLLCTIGGLVVGLLLTLLKPKTQALPPRVQS